MPQPVPDVIPEPISESLPDEVSGEPPGEPIEQIVEPMPSVPEGDTEPPMYPTIVEERPSEENAPKTDRQEKPAEKIADIDEQPGENIAFL